MFYQNLQSKSYTSWLNCVSQFNCNPPAHIRTCLIFVWRNRFLHSWVLKWPFSARRFLIHYSHSRVFIIFWKWHCTWYSYTSFIFVFIICLFKFYPCRERWKVNKLCTLWSDPRARISYFSCKNAFSIGGNKIRPSFLKLLLSPLHCESDKLCCARVKCLPKAKARELLVL